VPTHPARGRLLGDPFRLSERSLFVADREGDFGTLALPLESSTPAAQQVLRATRQISATIA
jgi:hypothetical protein